MNQFAICATDDELKASVQYCQTEGVGLELTMFAFPFRPDFDTAEMVHRCRQAAKDISPLSMHGPFIDLVATSPDPEVVSVTRQRHEVAMDAAASLGISHYITHTNYMPMIRISGYRENWIRSMLDFWLPLADKAGRSNMVICLENVWENSPEIQVELISLANHPHLRATFDNGHALIFSKISSAKWVEILGSCMAHCHLSDNFGEIDEHSAVGAGRENWPALMTAIRTHSPQATLVAEADSLEKNRQSITRLKKL